MVTDLAGPVGLPAASFTEKMKHLLLHVFEAE